MLLPPGQAIGDGSDSGGDGESDLHRDQHGVHRHFTDQAQGLGQEQGQENLLLPPSVRNKNNNKNNNNNNNNNNNRLRGNSNSNSKGDTTASGDSEGIVQT